MRAKEKPEAAAAGEETRNPAFPEKDAGEAKGIDRPARRAKLSSSQLPAWQARLERSRGSIDSGPGSRSGSIGSRNGESVDAAPSPSLAAEAKIRPSQNFRSVSAPGSKNKKRLSTHDLKQHVRSSASSGTNVHFSIGDERIDDNKTWPPPRFCLCCVKYDGRIVCAKNDAAPPRKIPILSRLLLSPYEKWKEYGVIPFKAILHVLLSVLTIVALSMFATEDGLFLRRASESTCHIVMPRGFECDHGNDIFTVELNGEAMYTVEDFMDSLEHAVHSADAYFTGQKHTLDGSFFKPAVEGTNQSHGHLNFEMTYRAFSEESMQQMARSYGDGDEPLQMFHLTSETHRGIISVQDLGPFDRARLSNATIRENVMRLQTLEVRGKINRYFFLELAASEIAQCTEWTYDLTWDFKTRGLIVMNFDDFIEDDCTPSTERVFSEIFTVRDVFELLQFILSLVVFVLNARGILRRCKLVRTLRIDVDPITGQLKVIQRDRAELVGGSDNEARPSCFSFIPFSHWALALGTACTAFKSAANLYAGNSKLPSETGLQITTALGVLLTTYLTRRYMETRGDHGTYVLFAVLDKSIGKIMMFLFSCMPIFFGFAGAGVVLFSDTIRLFSDISRAMMTLFCLSHGDSMINVFDAVWWSHGWIGYVYLYIWVSLVICVVLNILLTIIIASYDDIMQPKESRVRGHGGSGGRPGGEADEGDDVQQRILGMAKNISPDEKNIRPLTQDQLNVLSILAAR
jgi:hypothetical protein